MTKYELPKELKVMISRYNVEFISDIPMEVIYDIIDWIDNCHECKGRTIKYAGSGSYSSVFNYKNRYAIKRLDNPNNAENRDIQVLKDIKHLDCIPTIYAVIENKYIIIDYIDGLTVRDYCEDSKTNPWNLDEEKTLSDWQNSLVSIILEGYTPDDLHQSNVMIERATGKLKMVDVGWFFKNKLDYDEDDFEKIKSNYGYSRADGWTGRELRSFFNRIKRLAEIDRVDKAYEARKAVLADRKNRDYANV